MRKIFCDKCGKEIKIGFLNSEVEEPIKISGQGWDLCDACLDIFTNWRKDKQKVRF